MLSIRKAIGISSAERYINLILQILSTIIIARLLTPEQIGIYSVGAAIVALAQIVRDFGIANYLIQQPDLTDEKIRTASTITLLIGSFLGCLTFISSGAFSSFYQEPGLEQVLKIVALNFFLIPFGAISLTLLRRAMKFKTTFWIGISSTISHTITGITLAWLDFGYFSLAWASVAGVATTVIGSLIAAPEYFLRRPTLSERHSVFAFGSRIGIANLATEISQGTPDLILGKVLGFSILGYFNRALGFVQLFERLVVDALRPVMLPYYSRENRNGQDLRIAYGKTIAYLLGIGWPFLAILATLAAPLVRILYGDQWEPAVPVAHILFAAIAIRMAHFPTNAVLVAHGAAQNVMVIGLFSAAAKILFLLVLAPLGLIPAAVGFVLAEIALSIVNIYVASQRLGIKIKTFFPILSKCLILSAMPSGSIVLYAAAFGLQLNFQLHLIDTIILLALGGSMWLVSIFIIKHPLASELINIFRLITNKPST